MTNSLLYSITLTVLFSSTTQAFIPTYLPCPCYTATTRLKRPTCPPPNPNHPCPVPDCVVATFVTVPGWNPECTKTPTRTSYLPCQTGCPTGCATSTFTSTLGPGTCLSSSPTPTVTIPHSTRKCYTSTSTMRGRCPEDDLGCPPPDCIYLSTTTIPGGVVAGCSVTPTVTEYRTCKGRCDGSCGTQWVTETAGVWRKGQET